MNKKISRKMLSSVEQDEFDIQSPLQVKLIISSDKSSLRDDALV